MRLPVLHQLYPIIHHVGAAVGVWQQCCSYCAITNKADAAFDHTSLLFEASGPEPHLWQLGWQV
jgi:hypothetical protein